MINLLQDIYKLDTNLGIIEGEIEKIKADTRNIKKQTSNSPLAPPYISFGGKSYVLDDLSINPDIINDVDTLADIVADSAATLKKYTNYIPAGFSDIDKVSETLDNIDFLAGATSDPEGAFNQYLESSNSKASKIIKDARNILRDLLPEDAIAQDNVTIFYIGDIAVDRLWRPTEEHSSTPKELTGYDDGGNEVKSQSAEIAPIQLTCRVSLEGEDRNTKLSSFIGILQDRKIVRLQFDKIWESMRLVKLSPKTSDNRILIDLSFTQAETYKKNRQGLPRPKPPEAVKGTMTSNEDKNPIRAGIKSVGDIIMGR